jgi:hypothetical protein
VLPVAVVLVLLLSLGYLLKISSGRNSEMRTRLASVVPTPPQEEPAPSLSSPFQHPLPNERVSDAPPPMQEERVIPLGGENESLSMESIHQREDEENAQIDESNDQQSRAESSSDGDMSESGNDSSESEDGSKSWRRGDNSSDSNDGSGVIVIRRRGAIGLLTLESNLSHGGVLIREIGRRRGEEGGRRMAGSQGPEEEACLDAARQLADSMDEEEGGR